MTPPRSSLSAGVNGAALNLAKTKTVIPARGIITPQTVPKTTTSNKIQHRRIEKPPSEDEASLDDDEFVVPEDPVEQECFKCRLMATASSLNKKTATA